MKSHYWLATAIVVSVFIVILAAVKILFTGASFVGSEDIGSSGIAVGFCALFAFVIPILSAKNFYEKYPVMSDLPLRAENIIKSVYFTIEAGTVLYMLCYGSVMIIVGRYPLEIALIFPIQALLCMITGCTVLSVSDTLSKTEGTVNIAGALIGGMVGMFSTIACMFSTGVAVGLYETSVEDGDMSIYYIIMCSIIAALLVIALIVRFLSRRRFKKIVRVNSKRIKKEKD